MSLADYSISPVSVPKGTRPASSLTRADSFSGVGVKRQQHVPRIGEDSISLLDPRPFPVRKHAVCLSRETGEIARRGGSRSVTTDCGLGELMAKTHSWRRPGLDSISGRSKEDSCRNRPEMLVEMASPESNGGGMDSVADVPSRFDPWPVHQF